MNSDRQKILTDYISYIYTTGRTYDTIGKYIKHVTDFLEMAKEVNRRGYLNYKRENADVMVRHSLMCSAICDLLSFLNIGYGKREKTVKPLEKLDVISEKNKKLLHDFIIWLTDNKCIHVTHTIERIMDIDTRKTKVIESTPKTIESRRDIPIGRDLLGILKKFKACYNDSFYVTTGDEKFCEPRVYRNYYRHLVLNEVGLDRCIKFHGLRHSFATRMIASKADMKTTSRILGHSDVSTTMNLYVHPSMDDKLDAINKSMKNLFK